MEVSNTTAGAGKAVSRDVNSDTAFPSAEHPSAAIAESSGRSNHARGCDESVFECSDTR